MSGMDDPADGDEAGETFRLEPWQESIISKGYVRRDGKIVHVPARTQPISFTPSRSRLRFP